ncbi:DUF1853 family protein [Salinicola peritrichatus]|uniref:DUF1853 family protein n=1 Tax=Salinicola peritrichatus TaxID=1267424 RepID=UPI000DA24A6A|nr:DUF1853 family protein [Salinicola peritrichatus]
MSIAARLLDAFRPLDPALAADLTTLDKPWLRDVAWLLHAPDMATIGYAGRPTLTALGLAESETRRRWLAALAAKQALFDAQLAARRSQRLGIYHETLWQWIVQHAPRTRLLAHNVALRDGNRTLGELDLLYRTHAPDTHGDDIPRIEHAELAIKFFLGLPQGPGNDDDPSRWIGTGSFDSLAIKCHRLRHRQLPMALSPSAAQALARLLPRARLHQRIIMPGVLYHPWERSLRLPAFANPQAYQGLWCHHRSWSTLAAALPADTRGDFLIKPHWLAPPRGPGVPLSTLGDALAKHFSGRCTPCHLRLRLPDARACRLFVVTDDWPPAIPLPPRALEPSAR